jgi:glycosyltransferase involved in cell wall biosynthesis
MNPTFSVVIPVYNGAETLEETLLSALAQDFTDREIIVVNDGSTDATPELFATVKSEHPGQNLILVEQPHAGLGAARNRGIQEASGHYIALLDADDIWPEAKLSSCYEALQNMPDCDVLYHPVHTFGLGRERSRPVNAPLTLEKLLQGPNPLVPSATVLRRALLLENPFTEEERYAGAEDLHLWIRLLSQGAQFRAWPDTYSYYRETGGMSSRLEEHLRKVFAVLNDLYEQDYFPKRNLEEARRRKFMEAGRFYHKRGQNQRSEFYYSAADSKSLKILGLRILNWLGVKI